MKISVRDLHQWNRFYQFLGFKIGRVCRCVRVRYQLLHIIPLVVERKTQPLGTKVSTVLSSDERNGVECRVRVLAERQIVSVYTVQQGSDDCPCINKIGRP